MQISLKKNDQLISKEDVNVNEAFELYMLENFFNIKLNHQNEKILSFWKNDFDKSLKDHLEFLSKNLENQEIYNSKVSEILQELNIFDDTNESTNENNQQDEIDQSDENQDNQSPDSDENDAKKQQEDNQEGIESEYDFSEHKIEDQSVDSDSENQTSETIIQKYGARL